MKLYLDKIIYEGDRSIEFKEPIYIDIYHIERREKMVYFTWDFGMDGAICLDCFIIRNHSRLKEKIIKMCEFELFHSFFHYAGDPNYTHYNWSLYGNLKDNVILIGE